MRKLFTLVATLAIMLGLPAAVAAQDTEYTVVGSLEIAPEYTEAFLAQVKIVRDAALEVGIDERFQWQLYRWDDELLFVSPGQSPTDVFDEAGMVQAFQGTSAESRVMAAFQKVSSFNVGAQSQSVLRPRPSLGYEPANLAPAVAAGNFGGLYVINQWVKSGSGEAHRAGLKRVMELVGQMGGSYPILVSQDVIGDGSINIAVVFDNLSDFYGANSLEAGLTQSGLGAEWRAAGEALAKTLTRSESRLIMYLPEHSFQLADSSTQDN